MRDIEKGEPNGSPFLLFYFLARIVVTSLILPALLFVSW